MTAQGGADQMGDAGVKATASGGLFKRLAVMGKGAPHLVTHDLEVQFLAREQPTGIGSSLHDLLFADDVFKTEQRLAASGDQRKKLVAALAMVKIEQAFESSVRAICFSLGEPGV